MTQRFFENETVACLALSPTARSDGLCFAGTERSLYRSQDAGLTWQDSLASLNAGAVGITCAACAPQDLLPPLVLAGTMGGILRSAYGGLNWQFAKLEGPTAVVSALAADASGYAYAGTAEDGVFVSSDRGVSWARWNFGLLDLHVFSLVLVPGAAEDGGSVVIAGVETGIFYSSNNGHAWHDSDFPHDAGAVTALARDPRTGLLYAGTETGKLFRSGDQGRTWERIGKRMFKHEIGAIVAVAGRVLVASEGRALALSTDLGETWTDWNPNPPVDGPVFAAAAPAGLIPGAAVLLGGERRFME